MKSNGQFSQYNSGFYNISRWFDVFIKFFDPDGTNDNYTTQNTLSSEYVIKLRGIDNTDQISATINDENDVAQYLYYHDDANEMKCCI